MSDEKEFTALMQRYQSYVYTICYRFVLDAAQAEDLAQETFLAAYLHRDRCPAGNEKPWLARIAVNKAKDVLRSGWNRRVQLAVAGDEDSAEDPIVQLTGPPEAQPEEQSLRTERVCTAAALPRCGGSGVFAGKNTGRGGADHRPSAKDGVYTAFPGEKNAGRTIEGGGRV